MSGDKEPQRQAAACDCCFRGDLESRRLDWSRRVVDKVELCIEARWTAAIAPTQMIVVLSNRTYRFGAGAPCCSSNSRSRLRHVHKPRTGHQRCRVLRKCMRGLRDGAFDRLFYRACVPIASFLGRVCEGKGDNAYIAAWHAPGETWQIHSSAAQAWRSRLRPALLCLRLRLLIRR